MKREDKEKIVSETSPQPPNEEAVKREREKQEQERKQQAEEAEKKTRKPRSDSKVVIAAKTEQDKKAFEDKCRRAGETTCDMLVLTGYTFLGPEWNYLPPIKVNPDDPESPVLNEKDNMRGAYGDMFVAYGWAVIPPWLPVVSVTLSYGVVRLNMPSVKERMKGGFFSGLKERLKNLGKKKQSIQPEKDRKDGAQSNPGNN